MSIAAEYALAMTVGGFGLGGIIEGYKEAGFKGAALGGAAGFAAQIATAAALMAISLPALPLSLIALAAGPVASKFLVKKVFAMKKNLDDMIADMEARGELEQWVRQRVSGVFESLTAALEEECEVMLKDTQGTIDAIKEDLLQNEMQRQKLQEDYEEHQRTVKQILEKLEPVSAKVGKVLKGGRMEEGEAYA